MPGRTPPDTDEGWLVSHMMLSLDYEALHNHNPTPSSIETATQKAFDQNDLKEAGLFRLVSSQADVMTLTMAESLDTLESFQRDLLAAVGPSLNREYTFLSVTELSFYSDPEERIQRELQEKGLKQGTEEYEQARKEKEKRMQKYESMRLHPEIPDMDRVTFYPMEKRRKPDQNWYQLDHDERGNLMKAHGATGRKYAGDVSQMITSCVGLDEWEWGVTLFADDPRQFKRLIYEMRFDEVSAVYSEFGPFFTGFQISPNSISEYLD